MPININPSLCLGLKCLKCLPFYKIKYIIQLKTFRFARFSTLSLYALYSVLVVLNLPLLKGSALIGTLFLIYITYLITKHQKSLGKLVLNNNNLALQLVIYKCLLLTLFIECLYIGQGLNIIPSLLYMLWNLRPNSPLLLSALTITTLSAISRSTIQITSIGAGNTLFVLLVFKNRTYKHYIALFVISK